jgi:hypothetical protein
MGQRDYEATFFVLCNSAHNVGKTYLTQEPTHRQTPDRDNDLWSHQGELLVQKRSA